MTAPVSLTDLEEKLSDPTDAVVETLRLLPGDLVVLGAGGKMGPSLTRMAKRASALAGTTRRVIAVSRFSDAGAASALAAAGVEIHSADLSEPETWPSLPDAALVVFMAGQKFGTVGAPGRTWFTNTVVPAWAAARYRRSRIAAFSTGNVYPLVPVSGGGSRESDAPAPVGEYAQSCLGRERVFEFAAESWGTAVSILRLNYAVDLRYGVLVDIARKVFTGEPVDVRMGYVNCIWQGDANALALMSLGQAAAPALPFNVTGTDTLSVRTVAQAFATRFGREVQFAGEEASDALLSNTSRMQQLLGSPRVSSEMLIDWVASWVAQGGQTLGKPTRFEQREGAF